jgi:hypothetical protein
MADDPDPPRKHYRLKPTEFERVNDPVGTAPLPDSAAPTTPVVPPTVAAAPTEAIDVRDLARLGSTGAGAPLLGHNSPAHRANEVHAMLAANHAQAVAAGLEELAPLPPRKSKRKRDYLVLLAAGNGFIFIVYLLQLILGFQVHCLAMRMPFAFGDLLGFALTSPHLYAIPAVGAVFFSLSLTWVMFSVMNDY